MSRKPEDSPLDFSQGKAPVFFSDLLPSVPFVTGSSASSVLLEISRDTDSRAPAFIFRSPARLPSVPFVTGSSASSVLLEVSRDTDSRAPPFIFRSPALLPSVPFVTGSSASSVLLEVSRDTDSRAPPFIFRSPARLMEVERLAEQVQNVLEDFKWAVVDPTREVLAGTRRFYEENGGTLAVEDYHLRSFIRALDKINLSIDRHGTAMREQRTVSEVLIQGAKSVDEVRQAVRRVQTLLRGLAEQGNVNYLVSKDPPLPKRQLKPGQLMALLNFLKYQRRLMAIQNPLNKPPADWPSKTRVDWIMELPALLSTLWQDMKFNTQHIKRRSDRLALLFSGKWKDGERASLVQPLSHWKNALEMMLRYVEKPDCPDETVLKLMKVLDQWLSKTSLVQSLFLLGDEESIRLQQQLISVLSRLEAVLKTQGSTEELVIAWRLLLSKIAPYDALICLLPSHFQRQVLSWDWPAHAGAQVTDGQALMELQAQLMVPLTVYASTKAQEYASFWFGGRLAQERVTAAVDRLVSLPALVIYRWSGALLHLFAETDGVRFRAHYEALVVDWLADGGSVSLGKALRSTPFFSFAPLYSDQQIAREILRENRTLPFQWSDFLGRRATLLQSMGRQPYLPVVLQTVLSQLMACDDRFTAWLSEQEEAGPLSAKEAAQASGFQAALTRLQRQLRYEVSLEPGRLIEQAQEVMMGFRESWHLYLYCQFEGRSEDCLGLFRAAERYLGGWQSSLNQTADTMQRALEQVIHAAASAGGGLAVKMSVEGHLLETLKHLLVGLGGVHKVLVAGNHLIAGLRVGESILSTMEITEGMFETSEATFGLIGGSRLGHQLKHWYEKKTGDLSVETQLQNVANAFPSMGKYLPRVELLVKRILQVYSNQFASLTTTSQMELLVYITGMVLAYIKYGLASSSVQPRSDDEFAEDVVGWLVFADYAMLTSGRLSRVMRDVPLTLQSGGDVQASALLGQASVLCQDSDGKVFHFLISGQNPGYGYRLALPCEVRALNDYVRARQRSGTVYKPQPQDAPIVMTYDDDLKAYTGNFEVIPRYWETAQERQAARAADLDTRHEDLMRQLSGITEKIDDLGGEVREFPRRLCVAIREGHLDEKEVGQVIETKYQSFNRQQTEEIRQLRGDLDNTKFKLEQQTEEVKILKTNTISLRKSLIALTNEVRGGAEAEVLLAPHRADPPGNVVPEEEAEEHREEEEGFEEQGGPGPTFEREDELNTDPPEVLLERRRPWAPDVFHEQAAQRVRRQEHVVPSLKIELKF